MIKRLFILTIATYSVSSLAFCRPDILLEIKGSGFIPTSHLFKKIYHSAGMVGGELSVGLYENLYAWASIDWLSKSGYSLIGHSKTRVNYLPIGFGLKYFVPVCDYNWYIAGGALAGRVHTHDFSPFVAPTYTKWGWGGIVKGGVLFDIFCSSFIDIFVNYSAINAHSSNTNGGTVVPHKVKVHGVIVGAGFGYRW